MAHVFQHHGLLGFSSFEQQVLSIEIFGYNFAEERNLFRFLATLPTGLWKAILNINIVILTYHFNV